MEAKISAILQFYCTTTLIMCSKIAYIMSLDGRINADDFLPRVYSIVHSIYFIEFSGLDLDKRG